MESTQKKQNPFERKETADAKLPPTETAIKGDFSRYSISERTVQTLRNVGYSYLFPIQQATYNDIFSGSDLIGRDRTGSGKTLAFALPLLERLRKAGGHFSGTRGQRPLILALVPTRELAMQVTKEFEKLRNSSNEFRVLSVYGGTSIDEQIFRLRGGVEVIVGTPGRVMDLQDRRELVFSDIAALILDETDQMLNFGFQEDIERILANIKSDMATKERNMDTVQVLLFSATIPRWVDKIAQRFMKRNLVRADMIKDSAIKTSTTVEHYCIAFPNKDQKIAAIGDIVNVYGGAHSRTIIFTDTKEEANDILLHGQLKIDMQVLHGDIPQAQREVTFKSFRSGKLKCLVATNVAARGLDIPEVDLIIQLSPPKEIDTYIHRAGRTGRAGKSGVCITFYSKLQRELLDKIEFKTGVKVKKTGAPQPIDIVRASARDIAHSFDNVAPQVLECFGESVDELLEHYEPREALCRALAIISGYTKAMKQRSLLFSTEGFITYIIESDKEVNSMSTFYNFLRASFPPHIADGAKGMRFLANHKGAVFDLDERHRAAFDEAASLLDENSLRVYAAKELPEIEDREVGGGSYGGYNNSYGGFSGRGGGFNSSKPSFGEPRTSNFTNSKRAGTGNLDSRFKRPDAPEEDRKQNNDGPRYNNNNDYNNDGHKPAYNNYASSGGTGGDGVDETRLFVANLGEAITEDDIREYLSTAGFAADTVMLTKNPEGVSKGFGYVTFNDKRTAKAALDELANSKLKGKQLRVSFAMKKK